MQSEKRTITLRIGKIGGKSDQGDSSGGGSGLNGVDDQVLKDARETPTGREIGSRPTPETLSNCYNSRFTSLDSVSSSHADELPEKSGCNRHICSHGCGKPHGDWNHEVLASVVAGEQDHCRAGPDRASRLRTALAAFKIRHDSKTYRCETKSY